MQNPSNRDLLLGTFLGKMALDNSGVACSIRKQRTTDQTRIVELCCGPFYGLIPGKHWKPPGMRLAVD